MTDMEELINTAYAEGTEDWNKVKWYNEDPDEDIQQIWIQRFTKNVSVTIFRKNDHLTCLRGKMIRGKIKNLKVTCEE